MSCAIYTITDQQGKCLYVGSTIQPTTREKQHATRFPNGRFKVIEMVSSKNRSKAEKSAILKFKESGEAEFNKRIPSELFSSIVRRIKTLRIGQSFAVKTESERVQALNIAKILGLRIATRARDNKRGGFTVTRLPE